MNKFIYHVILSLATLPLLWNLLKPGFYTSHDGEWMVIRLTAFHQALRDGQFPVRWLPRLNHGYGYPVTNFLYPLPFYLAEPFYVLTGDPTTAVQIVMGLSVVAMALGMYAFLSSLTTNHPARLATQSVAGGQSLVATIGAFAYVYSPYIAFNLYQRGSLGELVAMGIVPWVFWAIRRRDVISGSIFIAALITSHNVVATLFFPLIVFFVVYNIYKIYKHSPSFFQRKIYYTECGRITDNIKFSSFIRYSFTISLGLGLSAFFWLPALAELRYVRASTIAVSDFQNEYLPIDVAFKRAGLLAIVSNLGLPLYFLTDISKGFWEVFKPLQVIQFPWRLLSVFSFTGAAFTTFVFIRLQKKKTLAIIFGVIVLFISFQSSQSFRLPLSAIHYSPSYYETNDDTTTVRAEYAPIWVKDLPKERPSIPLTHYYPGWRAFLDGMEVALLDPSKTQGVLKNVVDSNRVVYKWSETPFRTFSNLVSIASMVGLLYWEQRRQQKQERGQRGHVRAGA